MFLLPLFLSATALCCFLAWKIALLLTGLRRQGARVAVAAQALAAALARRRARSRCAARLCCTLHSHRRPPNRHRHFHRHQLNRVEYTEEDPKPQLEEACKVECVKEWQAYKDCAERIKSDATGEAHCTGWAFDYWKCIDKCVRAVVDLTDPCLPSGLCCCAAELPVLLCSEGCVKGGGAFAWPRCTTMVAGAGGACDAARQLCRTWLLSPRDRSVAQHAGDMPVSRPSPTLASPFPNCAHPPSQTQHTGCAQAVCAVEVRSGALPPLPTSLFIAAPAQR